MGITSVSVPPSASPAAFIRRLCAGLVFVSLFVAGMVAAVLSRAETEVRAQAAVTVENLARVLEENLNGFVDTIDVTLQTVADEATRQDKAGGIDRTAFEAFLARQDSHLSEALGLRVINAQGGVDYAVTGVTGDQGNGVNIADREHFIRLRDNPTLGLVISPPRLGRVSGKWVIVLARRRTGPDGAFAGVVEEAVAVEHFYHLFSSLNLGPHGTATLFDDRAIVARYLPGGGFEEDVGRATPSPALRALITSGQRAAPYHARSGTDGVMRTFFFLRVGNHPLSLVIGLADDDYLTEWRHQALVLTVLAAAFLVVMLGLAGLIYRGWRRYTVMAAALARQEAANTLLLRHSNAELEQFAYVASHDLREPLRMVSSYVTLLERRLGATLDHDCRQFIAYARDGAQRMDRLILDLLDYSRLGRGDIPLVQVDLGKVVAEASSNLAVAIDQAQAHLEVPDSLPTVLGVHGELVRLLQNLIANAVKYRGPDRPVIVTLSAQSRDRLWEVRVADNGIGIDAQHYERVFMIFQRLHGRGDYEGTGIGLAVCKKIVEHHGGDIWVESQPGLGSTFIFTLPAVPE